MCENDLFHDSGPFFPPQMAATGFHTIPLNCKGAKGCRLDQEAAGRWAGTVQLSVCPRAAQEARAAGRVAPQLTEGICKPWSSGCPSRQRPRVRQRWGPNPAGRTAGRLRCWCRRGRSLCCRTPESQDVQQFKFKLWIALVKMHKQMNKFNYTAKKTKNKVNEMTFLHSGLFEKYY